MQRVLAFTHDDDAGDRVAHAIQVGDAAPDVRSERHVADVAHTDRHAAVASCEDDVADVRRRFRVAASAHHVFGAGHLDQTAADVVVSRAHRVEDFRDRQVEGAQTIRIDLNLVLSHEAAERRDFRDAWYRLEVVAKRPVLIAAELVEPVTSRRVNKGVLKNPADAGRVGTELRPYALRQPRQNTRQVLQRARPRPIDVGPFLEHDVDVREPEVRQPANRLDFRRTEHRGHDGIRDLVFDDVRTPVPARVDDYLGVAEIGNGVERHCLHRPGARDDGDRHQQEDDEAVLRREFDDGVNHGRDLHVDSREAAARPCRSSPPSVGSPNRSERCLTIRRVRRRPVRE